MSKELYDKSKKYTMFSFIGYNQKEYKPFYMKKADGIRVWDDEGKEYIQADDDMKNDKNSDNTANFTDSDYATHGVVEVVESDGQQYIVVAWAKDTSDVQNFKLAQQLTQFNKDNKVKAISF